VKVYKCGVVLLAACVSSAIAAATAQSPAGDTTTACHVSPIVSDLDRSARFYSERLGSISCRHRAPVDCLQRPSVRRPWRDTQRGQRRGVWRRGARLAQMAADERHERQAPKLFRGCGLRDLHRPEMAKVIARVAVNGGHQQTRRSHMASMRSRHLTIPAAVIGLTAWTTGISRRPRYNRSRMRPTSHPDRSHGGGVT
jgi:hypothetical protein